MALLGRNCGLLGEMGGHRELESPRGWSRVWFDERAATFAFTRWRC